MTNVAVSDAVDYGQAHVSEALDALFVGLGLDPSNPFGHLVEPGQTVFIKPNWVAHRYRASCPVQDSVWSTITHPAVIEQVAQRVAKALRGSGRIVIGDNPSIDANFDELVRVSGLQTLPSRLDVETQIVDLRPLVCVDLADYGIRERMVAQPGDPLGQVRVDLARDSQLFGLPSQRFRGVFTDTSETVASHSGDTHVYELSRSIVDSDLYISIPKLKTHHKVGTTLNLKGLVGTVANKNQLVHWRTGYPEAGGDEYPDRESWEAAQEAVIQKRGAWMGNDTIWRMVVDLYTALQWLRTGKPSFSVIDGVVAGQGEGPFCPRTKNARVMIASPDLLAADLVASRLMGFDVRRIPYLNHYLETGQADLEEIDVTGIDWPGLLSGRDRALDFEPPATWQEAMV